MSRANNIVTFKVIDRDLAGVLRLDIWEDGKLHLYCSDSRIPLAPANRVGSFLDYINESKAVELGRTMKMLRPDDYSDHAPDGCFAVLEWPFERRSVRFPVDHSPGELSHLVRRLKRMIEDLHNKANAALEIKSEGGSGPVSKWSEPPLTFTVANVGRGTIHVDPGPGIMAELTLSGNNETWDTDCKCDSRNKDMWDQFSLPPGQRAILFPTGLEIPVPDDYQVDGAVLMTVRSADIPGEASNRWLEMRLGFERVTMDVT